ncbi:MAG: type II secretion system protein [Cyanobacteria bacterium SIG32]|nr:type II secretion system protein [Cyanobacteria bacterium SIG32]
MKNPVKNLITWSPSHLITSPKSAFTLAEVLITLAIIGVVAAMTIPTLIQDYKKNITTVKLQKVFAELNQVMRLAEAENGSMDTWTWNNMSGETNSEKLDHFLENYFSKYIKIAKTCNDEKRDECIQGLNPLYHGSAAEGERAVITQSGYSIRFGTGGISSESSYSPHLHFLIDINGPHSGKNAYGSDIFLITANFGPQKGGNTGADKNAKASGLYFFGNGAIPAYTQDELMDTSGTGSHSCSMLGFTCGAIIQNNGWKIPDNYPHEF